MPATSVAALSPSSERPKQNGRLVINARRMEESDHVIRLGIKEKIRDLSAMAYAVNRGSIPVQDTTLEMNHAAFITWNDRSVRRGNQRGTL